MSNLNELSTKQKGKPKRMVMGLEVQVAPSMRKENTQKAPLSRERKAQQSLVQGEYGNPGKSKREVGHGLCCGFQPQQCGVSGTSTDKHLGGTLLLRRLQGIAEG